MKRIMAIDYGDARTGIAISDQLGILTGESFVIKEYNPKILADLITEKANELGVETLVLGLPKNMDGTEGDRAHKSRILQFLLEERGFSVILWDERLTTVDAHRILRDNGKPEKKHRNKVDAVAASLILEGYLDSIKYSENARSQSSH